MPTAGAASPNHLDGVLDRRISHVDALLAASTGSAELWPLHTWIHPGAPPARAKYESVALTEAAEQLPRCA